MENKKIDGDPRPTWDELCKNYHDFLAIQMSLPVLRELKIFIPRNARISGAKDCCKICFGHSVIDIQYHTDSLYYELSDITEGVIVENGTIYLRTYKTTAIADDRSKEVTYITSYDMGTAIDAYKAANGGGLPSSMEEISYGHKVLDGTLYYGNSRAKTMGELIDG